RVLRLPRPNATDPARLGASLQRRCDRGPDLARRARRSAQTDRLTAKAVNQMAQLRKLVVAGPDPPEGSPARHRRCNAGRNMVPDAMKVEPARTAAGATVSFHHLGRSHRRGDGRVATPVDGRHSTHRAFRYFIDDKLTVPSSRISRIAGWTVSARDSRC